MNRYTRKKIVLLVVIASALAALFALRGPARRIAAMAMPAPAPQEIDPLLAETRAPPPPPLEGPSHRPAAPTEPIVDAIQVEKRDVCAGEESLVTVRAHAADGDDAHLRVFIDGEEGDRVPVRALVDFGGRARPVTARVVAGDGSVTEVAVPIVAHPCEAPARAAITSSALANTWDQYRFVATLTEARTLRTTAAAKIAPKDVRTYEWDFGDGSPKVTTRSPVVEHSFEGRVQERVASTFVVGVEARLADGRRVKGRRALSLENHALHTLEEKGVALIMSSATPRFPVAAEDGSVTQRVHLWQATKEDIAVMGMAKYGTSADGQRAEPIALDPRELGVATIPARTGVDITVTLSPGPDMLVTYELFGRTADGREARGVFSVMRPPPPPTAENATPITDEKLLADVRAARKLLGRSTVTDDDLATLRVEGRL